MRSNSDLPALLSVAVFLLTCFSAVYLNHHYVLDLIAGAAYALLVGAAMDAFHSRSWRRGNRARQRSAAA